MVSRKTVYRQSFQDYWSETLRKLSDLPLSPEIDALPIRTTKFATMYSVKLTSLGPYRLFAYLSIPKGDGPFPVRYYLPKYQSVLEPIPQGAANGLRSQFITFSIAARGQRNSDHPYAAKFPGWFIQDIDYPETYVFRSVVADCCQGLKFLVQLEQVDKTRIVAMGNDLSLIAAGLQNAITHVVTTPNLFHQTIKLAEKSQEYPLEEIKDYLNYHPDKKDLVKNTLDQFELAKFASYVNAKLLLITAANGELLDKKTFGPVIRNLKSQVTVHESEHSTYKDGLAIEKWLVKELELPEMILPEHWR